MALLENAGLTIGHLVSIALALAAWGYFLFFCVYWVKRAGIAKEEPPLWLYGTPFRIVRIVTFLLAAGVGYLLPVEQSVSDYFDRWGLALAVGFGLGLMAVGLLAAPLFFFLRWRRNMRDVVYEPLTPGQTVLRIILGLAAVGVAAMLPLGAAVALQMDVAALFQTADPGLLGALILHYVIFWMLPALSAWRAEENESEGLWEGSTGFQAVRWGLLGLILLLCFGMLGGIPGLDAFLEMPVALPLAVAPSVLGGIVYVLAWILPIRALHKQAAAEDFVAIERMPGVRMFGAPVYWSYLSKTRARGQKFSPEKASKLCPTCLRPIDKLGDYHKLRFDACPHCGNFIPPLYTVKDYLAYQNERLVPIIVESNDPASRKKRPKGEEEQRRIQELLYTLLSVAVAERGTDLHMSNEGDQFVIRCRTDGVMYPLCSYSKAMERPVISALKVMASLDITERRKPQDGSFKIEVIGKNIDVRVNTSPVPDGEVAAARLLYSRGEVDSLTKLGMSKRNERQMLDLIRRSSGLILVVGPTGSGKSTTLYNCLDRIATGDRNIITLEDPIEYKIDGVSQMQVNQAKGFTFATGLRSILRQDPDVIMVGEIRDGETAAMAINASATGHLVFSTIHSSDSVATIGRLSDLGIEASRFASATLLILSQRLIRMNCPECATEMTLTADQLVRAGFPGAPDESYQVRAGKGCPHCRDSGYYGREGIYEFFVPDDALQTMIAERASLPAIRREARARGMRTILEDGLTKVLIGHTTLEEIVRVAR